MTNLLLVLAALFLVLLNGFFVAAEFGLVKLRLTRVKGIAESGGMRGRLLLTVHQHLDAYLSACQLGITLASLGLGWIGEPAFARLLLPLFDLFGVIEPEIVHGVSFFFAFFVISFLHIVVGELAPKSMAIRMPEQVSLLTATPLYFFYWLMFPAIWLLNLSSNKILTWMGLDAGHGSEGQYTLDELRLILRGNHAKPGNTRDEWNILLQTLDFSGLEVTDLMRPVSEVVGMHRAASIEENLQKAAQHHFSRYPYFDLDGKTVLGMLHLKDLFLAQMNHQPLQDLSHYLRQVEYVRPNLSALELFRRFRQGAPHFALVGYEGSAPVGFLTLDNLLSALVGQIRDEFRQNENDWITLDDGTLMGKGSLPLHTLGMALGVAIDNPEVESIGGLIMQQLGDIPQEGMRISFERFDAEVKKMADPRIVSVRIYPRPLPRSATEHLQN